MPSANLKNFLSATRAARKIIVVDLGFLGDTVHLIPALWEIKTNYPQAELHVLTTPVGREVLKLAKCVNRAWAFPLGPPSPKWWEHWGVLRDLRREHFDVAFNFTGTDRPVFVTKIIGVKNAVFYQGSRKHFWQPWLFRNWIPRTTLPSPVYEGRRHLLSLCGFELRPARFELRIPEEEQRWASENIPAGSVHLSLSASFALKEWPMANNLALVRNLLATDFNRSIIVTAAPNAREQTRLKQLRDEINDARLRPIGERLSIARLAAALERCALHVGPDSGVIHLATALGIPTITILRKYWDMADWLPVGPQHTYFDAPCPCLTSKNPPCNASGEAACLKGISPELVTAEIRRRLSSDAATAPNNKS